MGNEFAINFAIFAKLTISRVSADARSKDPSFFGPKIKVRGVFRCETLRNINVIKSMFFLRRDN